MKIYCCLFLIAIICFHHHNLVASLLYLPQKARQVVPGSQMEGAGTLKLKIAARVKQKVRTNCLKDAVASIYTYIFYDKI